MGNTTDFIKVNPSSIVRVLGAMAFLLVLASTGGQLSKYLMGHAYIKGFVPLFYLDKEHNVPTFFSALLLLQASHLLALSAVFAKKTGARYVSKWVILSLGFLFMAYDEAFTVHEKLINPIKNLFGGEVIGIFRFAWVILGIPLVFFLGIFFLRFLLYLPSKSRRNFSIAAALYLGGAIFFELIGGGYSELYGEQNLTYSMIVTTEESLEIVGLITFIWALFVHLGENYKGVMFWLDGDQR